MCTCNDDELQCVIGTPGIGRCTDISSKHAYGVRMGRRCGQQQKNRERERIGREKTDESKGSVKKQNRNTRAQDCAQKSRSLFG